MYYGICLNCGDNSDMSEAINPKYPPKWLPNPNLDDSERKNQVKGYLAFNERLDEEELNELMFEKEFGETIIIYCPNCDEVCEMYYGICLNCGDDSEKEFALNNNESSKWMPSSDLEDLDKTKAIREYLNRKKNGEENNEEN